MEPRHIKMLTTAHTHLSFFHFGELVLFRIPLLHTRRTNQNRTIYRGDSRVGRGMVSSTGRRQRTHHRHLKTVVARIVSRLLLSQRVDTCLLKRVKGLPWDGQLLVRRGRLPKLVLLEPSMAETGETLRTGGSSSSGTRSLPIRLGLTDVKVDTETEWTLVTRRRRLRSKTPDLAAVEETKRLSRHRTLVTAPRWSWQTRKHGRERWWNRQKTTTMSLRRHIGELRTSWRRLRWTS